ncbi:MAG: 2-keto-3-deoxy-L-rhamnonate aldolase [Caldilineaceae bacterium]|nr:2-keto-3-deoxy-L-rhamnonate aldolase [Caldilineaceae bacterium]
MYPNPLKQKLANGELVLGTALSAPTAGVTAATCRTGIDFIWMDTEHAPYGSEALEVLPVLARQNGVAPMIRVAWNDPALIKKAYDVGAVAVMVPQVDTAEEAARAVEYAYYPPMGQRGVSPNWPIISGDDWGHVIRTANDETVLIVQIESRQAYENIEEIAKVPGVDVVFMGPMDLSASLGVITQMQDPALQEIMREAPRRLAELGMVAGTTLMDIDEVRQKIEWGYHFMNVGSPLAYGVQALTGHLTSLRG